MCVKFIPLQTFARVGSKSMEYVLVQLPECGVRNYNYIQCTFEAKEGVLGVAAKNEEGSDSNTRVKTGSRRFMPLGQKLDEILANFVYILHLTVYRPRNRRRHKRWSGICRHERWSRIHCHDPAPLRWASVSIPKIARMCCTKVVSCLEHLCKCQCWPVTLEVPSPSSSRDTHVASTRTEDLFRRF